ncbi:hypothetical protein V3W47_17315 [Deinococcus sp. YIM 134068]|uniref:hypothetical protein n=1 Tax=Deinococcus lichenicola TaxID=3118910 RepID=UPI002F9234BC
MTLTLRRMVGAGLLGLALLTACRSPATSGEQATQFLEDETTQALRKRYEGREVWVYGGGPLTCHSGGASVDYSGSPLTPIRVVGLSRVRQRTRVPLRGGTILPQEVDTPILLRVRVPESYEVSSGSTGGSVEDWHKLAQSDTCQEFTELYADEAHLSRELSLTPPPDDVREVVRRFRVVSPGQSISLKGLTQRQVLWLNGAPESPLTDRDTLLKTDEWTRFGPPGRGDWTLYFEGGRVIGESEPSPSP